MLTRTRQQAARVVAAAWMLGFVLGPLLHLARHNVAHSHQGGGTTLAPHAHAGHTAGHHEHGATWTFAPRGPWSDVALPTLGQLASPAPAARRGARAVEGPAPASSPTHPDLLHGLGSAAHLSAALAGGAAVHLTFDVRALALREPTTPALPAYVARPWRAVPPARGPPRAA